MILGLHTEAKALSSGEVMIQLYMATGGTVLLVLAYRCQTDVGELEKCRKVEKKGLERIFLYTCKKGYVFYMAWQ